MGMDMNTIRMREVFIIPPGPGQCPMCADVHDPKHPHNLRSLYYQIRFRHEHGRAPTWADALAHCDEAVKNGWVKQLAMIGIQVYGPDGNPV
jgi:hypothetical protein